MATTTAAVPAARRAYFTAGAILVVALVAVYVFPQLDKAVNPTSTQPGLITFLGVGLSVLGLTAAMLFAGLRNLLPRTAIFLAAAFGYNAIVVIVKFALGPLGLYAANEGEGFVFLSGDAGAWLSFPGVAAIAAILYGGAFFFIFMFFRSDLRRRLGIPVQMEARFIVLLVVMFMIAVAGGTP